MRDEESFGIVVTYKKEDAWYFLLVKTAHWGFPKGHADGDETNLETAQREVFEETGVRIDEVISDISFTEKYTVSSATGKEYKKIVHYFLSVLSKELKVEASNEAQDARWFSYEEAKKTLTYKEAKSLLETIHEWLLKNI